jgi:hypothetical protein
MVHRPISEWREPITADQREHVRLPLDELARSRTGERRRIPRVGRDEIERRRRARLCLACAESLIGRAKHARFCSPRCYATIS